MRLHGHLWFECEIPHGLTFEPLILRWLHSLGSSFAEESVLGGGGFDTLYPAPPPIYPVLPEFGYNVTSQLPATMPSLTAIFLPNHDRLYPTRTISQSKPILP